MSAIGAAVFLDIDGVLNNRSCYFAGNTDEYGRKPDAACIAALNKITDATGAAIVVSSAWRADGLMRMRGVLKAWGVSAPVIGCTPCLRPPLVADRIYASIPRGHEIQAWLDKNASRFGVDRFVILDDDADMDHLAERLVQTDFAHGLTEEHASRAIAALSRAGAKEGE